MSKRECFQNMIRTRKVVRMFHMNTFGRVDLENMNPKTQNLTKSDFLKNDNVLKFGKVYFWARKSPCGMPHRQKIAFKHILD